MLFNSINYIAFFTVVFTLYWFVFNNNLGKQNFLLLIASYVFYACWDWRFLFLLAFSTLLDYYTGIKISEAANRQLKKKWLLISVVINLGFLGFFKYYNFFISSFAEGLGFWGLKANVWTLQIILPVGISFYTFHGLSYVLDLYYERIKPERNFVDYSLFVSFFPLLVAGPIERATHLLPQLKQKRTFDYNKATDGLKQILWGVVKKVVIADNCALFANDVFDHYQNYHPITLIAGVICFAFQIYGDFSGYSDIALGSARLLGVDLLKNFSFPYFSRDIAEFWRRWHISLSSWFRDYVYIPLGGSKGSNWIKARNTFVIFILSGFWHGANWTFIAWGFLNALYFLPLLLTRKNRLYLNTAALNKPFPSVNEFIRIFCTFFLVCFAWIFFRSPSVTDSIHFIKQLLKFDGWFMLDIQSLHFRIVIILLIIFILTEWLGRQNNYAIEKLFAKRPSVVRYSFYYFLIFLVLMLGGHPETFIYFQF